MADELRLQTLSIQRKLELVTETCSSCGVLFAMDKELQQARVVDKRQFYCPNGHSQHYLGKSETQKLREQLDEERRQRQSAEQRVAMWQDDYKEADARATRERNRANGYKGHATRITKRAKAGVCPCCNRTFQQLARHMATKHPQFTPIELEQVPRETTVQ